jgi:PAS domain S-box-containing protein
MTDANPSYCELFGYTREEMIGKDIRELCFDPPDYPRFQKEIEKQGFVKDYELKGRKRDGTQIECLLTSSVHFGKDGSITGYRGILRDRTAYKALQKQLLQAQKMEATGTLAGGIAHDFNNLLTVVMGFSELMLVEKRQDGSDREDIQKIFHAARNGADLVQRLLTFSRKSEPKPVPMNLNKQIVQVEKLLRRTIPRMIDIQLELSADLPEINADPSQVEQVLMNLAVNARDAMTDKGKLTVRTDIVTLDEEYCRLHVEANPGEYVLLEVSDTGHGMDKATVEHIFEPFFTTKEVGRGTGLGLAMVHGIVKQHNGHITVYSEVGKGTTFRVYLPAIPAYAEPDVEDSGMMPAFGTETVLLVDDEEFVRELGARILTKHGYTILQAVNGREALDLFKKQRSQISLVILDLIMPNMGGKECLKELLKIDPQVNVLVASGYSADASVKETIQMGAKGFAAKPFRVNELLRDVRKVLDES